MKLPTDKRILTVRQFVKKQFIAHPHHSFGDGTVMANHSFKVEELAARLAQEETKIDLLALRIGALLHDIGKVHLASEEELHAHHKDFNWLESKDLLKGLHLEFKQLNLIKELISDKSTRQEAAIIKDADILAFFIDKRLNMLFIKWATERNLTQSIEKKLDKFKQLELQKSREIGFPWYQSMKFEWENIISNIR